MDKKTAQAIAIVIFSGVLFLQAFVTGGVASEETALVVNAMRSLRRVDNLSYSIQNTYVEGSEKVLQVQTIWANLLTGSWAEECTNSDVDGTYLLYRLFCDGNQVQMMENAEMWYTDDSMGTEIPNLTSFLNLPYGLDDISNAIITEKEGGKEVVLSLTDDHLEKQKEELLGGLPESASVVPEAESGNLLSIYYEQYQKTRYENVKVIYSMDENGVLAGMKYTMDMIQPKVEIDASGKRTLGEEEAIQAGVEVKVLSYNSTAITDKINEIAADAGYDK